MSLADGVDVFNMLNGLDLFSGIGGLTLALKPWVRPVVYCEIDRYAEGVLLSRMAEGALPVAPIWDDIATLDCRDWEGRIDIVYGGFPCQDISVAGNGAGLEGKRSGLFFEIARLVGEIKPAFVFLENVPAIRTRGGETVGKTLASLGYDCRWDVVSAQEIGAPHLRKRWFLLAHVPHPHPHRRRNVEQRMPRGRERGICDEGTAEPGIYGEAQFVADAESVRHQGRGRGRSGEADCNWKGIDSGRRGETGAQGPEWWSPEPDVGRVVDGLPFRVDRIKCLGNSVVPLQAREAFARLLYGPS